MIFLNNNDEKEVATTHKPDARKSQTNSRTIAKKLLRKQAAAKILSTLPAAGESYECITNGASNAGGSYECITNGASNAGGFYEVIRDKWGKVDELHLATWIMNRDYIDMLFNDLDTGALGNLTLIISNRMQQLGKGHAPAFNALKSRAIGHPNVKFRVANSHAKVFCLTNGCDHITVSGSGNWSENPRIENYCITNDLSKFQFHKNWMIEVAKAD